MKNFLVLCLSVLSLSSFAGSVQEAKVKIDEAIQSFNDMVESNAITFQDARTGAAFNRAMTKLQNASTELNEVAQSGQPVAVSIEANIERAQFLKTIMMSFFSGRDDFHQVYFLKNEDFSVEFSSSKNLEICILNIPFLKAGISKQRGVVSRREVVSQFNKLRSEFYNELSNAGAINSNDSRYRNLKSWARETTYSSNGDTFMAPGIISMQEYMHLP